MPHMGAGRDRHSRPDLLNSKARARGNASGYLRVLDSIFPWTFRTYLDFHPVKLTSRHLDPRRRLDSERLGTPDTKIWNFLDFISIFSAEF